MQITAGSALLANCLETVEKALPTRSTMPVINNIYLEVKPGSLLFAATNLEMFIEAEMTYNGSESAKILLPPKIVEIMRYFPTPEVLIDFSFETKRIEIRGGQAQFHLYGSGAEDFPLNFSQNAVGDQTILIEQGLLKKMLRMVVFASSLEENRPAFNGVLFSLDQNVLTVTASDTYRLAIKKCSDDKWAGHSFNLLVPARTLREYLRITGDSQSTVALTYSNSIITFHFDHIYFSTRLLAEKYPDVSGVFPRDYLTRILVDRKTLEETIARANLLAEGKNQTVNLLIKDEEIEIRASGQEGSMEDIIPVSREGEQVDLLVNSRYIIDLLKLSDDEKVMIDFNGDGGPIIFRFPGDPDFLYLALPIKKYT